MPSKRDNKVKHESAEDFLTLSTKLRQKMEKEHEEAEDLLDKVVKFCFKFFTGQDIEEYRGNKDKKKR